MQLISFEFNNKFTLVAQFRSHFYTCRLKIVSMYSVLLHLRFGFFLQQQDVLGELHHGTATRFVAASVFRCDACHLQGILRYSA